MAHDPDKIREFFQSLSPAEIEAANQKNHEEHVKQVEAFKKGYESESCYLCGKPFKTISKDEPCLHWLLRRCKFRKNDFPKIFAKYNYYNIASFLRWCANQERMHSNINDLEDEKRKNKIISYTIKWKNIEWTFDCSANDYHGHDGTKMDFPHYHFQMRIDGKRFISFNDYHIPFTDEDLFNLSLSGEYWFHQNFGAVGSGMQEAVDIPLDDILEHTISSEDEAEATFHFSTIIDASENPISGEELAEMQEEAKRTGKSLSLIAQKRLQGRAKVQTTISPVDTIPDIASRTEHKRR